MPISINIKKEAPKAAKPEAVEPEPGLGASLIEMGYGDDAPTEASWGDRVDQLGKLQDKVAQAKAFLKEYGDLEKALVAEVLEAHAEDSPDAEFEVKGQNFRLTFGKQSQTRDLLDDKKELLIELMTPEVFMACAKVTLKDIDQYLTGPQRDQVLEYGRGSRSSKLQKIKIK